MKNFIITLILLSGFPFQSIIGQASSSNDKDYKLYSTQVAAAEAFLRLNEISTAKHYLNACDRKYRDVEWRFLNCYLDQSARSVTFGENNTLSAVEVNPDGSFLAACGTDSIIRIFSLPELTFIRELKGHDSPVSTIAFSRDGKRLASGSRDHTVIVWDVSDGNKIWRNHNSFKQGIYQVRFSPDDSMIAVATWERLVNISPPVQGFVKLLDSRSGKEVKKFLTDPHPAAGVVFTNDGKNLIVSSWGEIVYSFNLLSGSINWKYDCSDPKEYNAFHSIDINGDGDLIALGSTDHRIHLLSTTTGSLVHRIEPWLGHSKIVKAVKFSRDGKWLATAGEDQTILVWDVSNFSKESSLIGHVQTVSGLAWSIQGEYLYSSSLDATMKEWNVSDPFEKSYEICNYGPWQTPVTRDGRLFGAPCSDTLLAIYEASTGKRQTILGPKSGLCADFSRDSRWMVTASFDGVVRLWDIPSAKETRFYKGHTARVDGIAFLNSQNMILSVGDTTLRVWSTESSETVRTLSFQDAPFRILLNPDESLACVSFNDGTIRLVSTTTWLETGSIKCDKGIQELAISPDGNLLAAFSGKNIEVWEVKTMTRKYLFTEHEKAGYGLGFSPDNRYLISGSYDQTFKLWNLEAGVCTFTSHGIDETIYSCKFLSGNELLIGTSQGVLKYYKF